MGIPKYSSRTKGGPHAHISYEKYPNDERGEEGSDDARVWKVYLDEADNYDDDIVRGFRDTIDSLLVFAALFSGVVTTFVVQTSQALQPNYAQISSVLLAEQILLLRANGNISDINAVPASSADPTYGLTDIWINGLFFTSLSLSLSTALLSVLVKQWIQSFTAISSGTAKSRALIRQFRFTGLTAWKLPEIIGILPLLLHGALAIFYLGLVVFVYTLHSSLSWCLVAVGGLTTGFYFVALILPAVHIQCPYRIDILYNPAQYAIWPFKYATRLFSSKKSKFPHPSSTTIKMMELDAIHEDLNFKINSRIICDALVWLHDLSTNPFVKESAARAMANLPQNFPYMNIFSKSRMANTVWGRCLAYRNEPNKDVASYRGWISAIIRLALVDPAQAQKLREEVVYAARNDKLEFVKQYIYLWSVIETKSKETTSPYNAFQNNKMRDKVFQEAGNALQAASAYGQLDTVKILLDQGIDVNSKGAMQAASLLGHLHVVGRLLERGADPNAIDDDYGTALQAASLEGHLNVVSKLLENGADVNTKGGKYGHPLPAAASAGHLDVVKALLEGGADVNAQDSGSKSALHYAVYSGRQEVANMLLDKGADINAQDGEVGNALHIALHCDHFGLVQQILDKGVDVNATAGKLGIKGEFRHALEAVSSLGRLNLIKSILEKGADINTETGKYGNAMIAALWHDRYEIMKLLLDHGADVNAVNVEHGSALYLASFKGQLDIVRLLLERGADANAKGGEHGFALQAATVRHHADIVKALLEKGANVNAQGGKYGTALIVASEAGNLGIVEVLLDAGAEVDAKVVDSKKKACFFALQGAAYNGRLAVMDVLLDKGADINAQGGWCNSALYGASFTGEYEAVKRLLKRGGSFSGGKRWGSALAAAIEGKGYWSKPENSRRLNTRPKDFDGLISYLRNYELRLDEAGIMKH